MGWWFGRIMTFEVIADPGPASVSSILNDASAGMIEADAPQTVIGYAAYGRSIAAAAQPLVDCFDPSLFDDGTVLRPATNPGPIVLTSDELGNAADREKQPTFQREHVPVRAVPSTLRLTYYDPARDYQTGEARASAGEQGTNEAQQDLPAVMSADDAKSLAQQMIARQWSARDRLTIRLAPRHMPIEPGSNVELDATPSSWVAQKSTIDGFVTVVELRPSWGRRTANIAAEAGRIVGNADVIRLPTSLALIDAPALLQPATQPTVLVAASSANAGWAARPLTISGSGQDLASQMPVRKSVLGTALTVVADSEPHLVDRSNTVDVQLVDAEQWITSCDDDALADGCNLAVLGNELIQFGDVTPLGPGRFRLKYLLRGRGGTEWAAGAHAVGERFCVLERNSVREIAVPAWMRGSTIAASDRDGSAASLTFAAESVRPLAPANLSAAADGGGGLKLSWTRRSRCGFAWLDEVDAPLGESQELYRVTIVGAATKLDLTTSEPSLAVAASDAISLGPGSASIEVRQIGDWAASRPAQLTVQLS